MSLSAALRTPRTATLAARSSRSLARSYATTADFSVANAHGIKVASEQNPASTGSISLVVNAGSRYSGAGLAHVLRDSVFKATSKRSAIRLVRETEMLGGVLSASLTREHLILTADFMRGDEAYFAEVLGDAVTRAKFAPHEYNEEVIPQVAAEYEAAIREPVVHALDLAHQLAFRTGLGNSLFASPHTAVDYNAATAFAHSAFSPSNLSVVASGVDSGLLASLVSEFFVAESAAPASTAGALLSPASSYFGGEVRVPSAVHGSPVDHLLLAFKGAPTASSAELDVLRQLLGGESSVKWSQGSSPLSLLAKGRSSAKAFNLSYSDAGLFGIVISAPTAGMKDLASKVVDELKKIAGGAANEEIVKQAIAKARFAAAASYETRATRLELVGAQVANSGSAPSLEQVLAQLDKVTVASVTKAAEAVLKSKPTTVAVGDTHALPYADQVGL